MNTTLEPKTEHPVHLRVRLPQEVHRALRHLAVDGNTSVADLILKACADLVDRR